MKARMRRLSASVDSATLEHQHSTEDSKNSDVTESRIDRVKKLLSSPLTRRKSTCNSNAGSSSCKMFGSPLNVVAYQEYTQSTSSNTLAMKSPCVPYIMTRLCDFMERGSGLSQEGIFRVSGNAKLVDRLRNSFDNEGDAPLETEGDIPSAAALLKLFLRELPEPVIPMRLHPSFVDAAKEYAINKKTCVHHIKTLVECLPNENFFMLKYLSNFLLKVSLHEKENRMNSASLGIVFGPNIFRISADDYRGLKEQAISNQIVSSFISDYEFIFEVNNDLQLRLPRTLQPTFDLLQPLHVDIPTDSFDSNNSSMLSLSLPDTEYESEAAYRGERVIPMLVLNNIEMPGNTGRKRKDRKFSGLGSPTAIRSCSEERPTCDPNLSLQVAEIRRCNSSEEMSTFNFEVTEAKSLVVQSEASPQPTEAKRRNPLESDACFESITPASESLENLDVNEVRRSNERTALIRRPPINRSKRLNAIKTCTGSVSTVSDEVLKDLEDDAESFKENINKSRFTCTRVENIIDFESEEQPRDGRGYNLLNEISAAKSPIDLLTGSVRSLTTSPKGVPPLDVNTLHQNAVEFEEPLVSEHRYSWPSLSGGWASNNNEEESHPSYSNTVHSYPLIQNTALQILKKNNSYEAPLSPSAFRGFLSQRAIHLDPTVPPSPPVEQELFSKNSNKSESIAMKEMKKRIHVVKKKVKLFEKEFENDNGYRPSHEQKMNSFSAKPLLLELTKLRKDLKEMKDDSRNLEPCSPSLWSFQERVESIPGTDEAHDALMTHVPLQSRGKEGFDSLAAMLVEMEKSLTTRRTNARRTEILDNLTSEQVFDEKLDLQKTLLRFESVWGRPSNKRDRDVMRPIYDRYRLVKRMVARVATKGNTKDAKELQPILENVAMNFTSPSHSLTHSRSGSITANPCDTVEAPTDQIPVTTANSSSSFSSLSTSCPNASTTPTTCTSSTTDSCETTAVKEEEEEEKEGEKGKQSDQQPVATSLKRSQATQYNNLHELPLMELLTQLQETRLEKRHLRRVIKSFEEDFLRRMARKVEREDRVQLESVYSNYKHVKGKLRLLEALVSKTEKSQHKL